MDSSFWIAFADNNEENHNKSIKIMHKLKAEGYLMVTTNFIFDETFTLIRKHLGLPRTLDFRDTIIKFGNLLQLERVTVADEENVWKWFTREINKLSYTDCTSFAVMNRLDIKKVATFDDDFEKVGFEIV